jgi:hypothetical protein
VRCQSFIEEARMGASVAESATDLKQLPLRALVAYAARCARRVQSQYKLPDGHPEAADCQAAIDGAIRVAEQFASGEEPSSEAVAQAEEAAVRAILVVSGEENGNSASAYAANAAYAAIDAATAGLAALGAADPLANAEKVADAAAIAFDAASAIRDDVVRPANLDWEMLRRMHLGKFPGIGEPVNPSEGGILGPLFCRPDSAPAKRNGAAKGSPKKQSAPAPASAPPPPLPPNRSRRSRRALPPTRSNERPTSCARSTTHSLRWKPNWSASGRPSKPIGRH